uniref:Uncharacterized protein n=1 Tax=Anguilla anguilla TaxID=7936 RepID=A0A0E9UM09_ANGAN
MYNYDNVWQLLAATCLNKLFSK